MLAVCSGGGHLEQLLCLKPSLGDYVSLCTTVDLTDDSLDFSVIYKVSDCNKNSIFKTLKSFFSVGKLIVGLKPGLIISTGAAPGVIAIFWGRLIGAKTIWIDSIANVEQLSMSGKLAGKLAHVWLTQWPHLEKAEGPKYWGNVL